MFEICHKPRVSSRQALTHENRGSRMRCRGVFLGLSGDGKRVVNRKRSPSAHQWMSTTDFDIGAVCFCALVFQIHCSGFSRSSASSLLQPFFSIRPFWHFP